MQNQIIERLLAKSRRTDIPKFGPGDTIKVQVKIKEGDKERTQAFEGVVISQSRGPQASFTVRKISFGQGVERIFPLNSKVIDRIDVMRSSRVRRAKLYYLRGLKGKAARLRDVGWPALTKSAAGHCSGRSWRQPSFSILPTAYAACAIPNCSRRSAAKCWRSAFANMPLLSRWPRWTRRALTRSIFITRQLRPWWK